MHVFVQSATATVYSGTFAAGLIARETGFKEGQAIRVFPFGYVAHDRRRIRPLSSRWR